MTVLDPGEFGPWAVVTGASSGIGEAFARELAARGFFLVLVARRRELLERLAAEFRQHHGTECRVVVLDLAEPRCIDTLRDTTDDLDVGLLVSNAGTATATEFVRWNAATLERDVALNTMAHLRLAHHFGGRLAARGRGGVLLVSSIAGRQPIPYLASYCASKSFVEILGASLNVELRPHGVVVTVMVAGPTDTPMRTAMGFGSSRLRPMSPRDCAVEGLIALSRRRSTHIPGRRTRLMLAFMPRRVISQILGRMVAQFAQVRP